MQDNSTLVSSTSAERMPLSYVEYLKAEGYNNLDTVEIFNNYNSYVKAWYKNAKTTDATNLPSISRILYINFLQEIALKYATVDEKRFLSNIDFNSDKDLDVVYERVLARKDDYSDEDSNPTDEGSEDDFINYKNDYISEDNDSADLSKEYF